jgi:hypothetical protein
MLLMRRRLIPYAIAATAYSFLTAVLTWPLPIQLSSVVPSDLGDPLLNIWIMWWNTQAVPLTDAWWNAPQFYPATGVLGFSEHLLGLAPITTPIILITGQPVLAYNIAFLLAFPLSALSAHFLVHTLTRRHDVAAAAALAFAFAPYRIAQLPHLQVISAYWMPLALAALHRYFDSDDRSPRWLAVFAVAWTMQALTCGYYLFYLSVVVALWLVWFAAFRASRRDLLRLACAWGAGAILLSPVLYGYWQIARRYNLSRGIAEIAQFSADVAAVLNASPSLAAWGWLQVFHRAEGELFPGLTVTALTALGLVLGWRRVKPEPMRYKRVAIGASLVAAFFLALTAARVLWGPFKLEIGSLRLFSVTDIHKPFSVATLCLVFVAALHPALRSAWRARSPLAFYVVAAAITWVLAIGPAPTFLGQVILYKAPYAWLMELPGFDSVRVPARFWMLTVLCLSVTAALALRDVMERWPRFARVAATVACAGILVDGWPRPIALWPPPGQRPSHTSAAVRLDLPLSPVSTVALYRATLHHRALMNGYSGYGAPHYPALETLLRAFDPAVLPRLAELGPLEIMVDREADTDGSWERFVAAQPGIERVFSDPDYSSYLLERRPRGTAAARGQALPIQSASASDRQDLLPAIGDGDLVTRWQGGNEQQPGQWLMVDLGVPGNVAALEIRLGRHTANFPAGLKIETSLDQQEWTEVWNGGGALAALSAGLEAPGTMPLWFSFEPRSARYVRLTQTAVQPKHYWVVAELEVLGRP